MKPRAEVIRTRASWHDSRRQTDGYTKRKEKGKWKERETIPG